MIVDGIEYTKCRVCDKYVETGGTLDEWTTESIFDENLRNHCENDHPEQLDERLNEVEA